MSKKCFKKISIVSSTLFVLLAIFILFFPNNPIDLFGSSTSRSNALVEIMYSITDSHYNIYTYLILIIIFIALKKPLISANFALSSGLTVVLTTLFKNVIGRSRPDILWADVSGYAYPSGHTSTVFVLAIFMIVAINMVVRDKIFRYILNSLIFIYALAISISRVVINVHWITDVIGGILLAIAVTAFVQVILDKYKKK